MRHHGPYTEEVDSRKEPENNLDIRIIMIDDKTTVIIMSKKYQLAGNRTKTHVEMLCVCGICKIQTGRNQSKAPGVLTEHCKEKKTFNVLPLSRMFGIWVFLQTSFISLISLAFLVFQGHLRWVSLIIYTFEMNIFSPLINYI